MNLYEFVIGSLVGKLSLPVLDLQWINGNFSRPRGNLSIPDCFPPMLPHISSTKISIEHLVSNNGLVVAFGVGDGLLNSTAAVTHSRDDVIHAPVPRSGTNMNRNWTNIWWYLSDPMGTPLASFGNEDGHLKNIPKCCQKNLEHDLSERWVRQCDSSTAICEQCGGLQTTDLSDLSALLSSQLYTSYEKSWLATCASKPSHDPPGHLG